MVRATTSQTGNGLVKDEESRVTAEPVNAGGGGRLNQHHRGTTGGAMSQEGPTDGRRSWPGIGWMDEGKVFLSQDIGEERRLISL